MYLQHHRDISSHLSLYYTLIFLPPANEVCEGYVFTRVCHSVHKGGLQANTRGGADGSGLGGGSPGPHPGGRLRGLAGRVSRPTPGECQGQGLGVYPSMH